MILTFLLVFISAALIFLLICLEAKLKDGERQIAAGKRKLEKYDNRFCRIFFNKKLQAGKKQLEAGKGKFALGKTVEVILIIVCVVCVIWTTMRIIRI